MGAELLLLPLTPLYSAAVRLRAAAYRHGVARVESLAAPVVSVGNLTFGGTGKTPVVTALARDLARRGRRPAVLTRGYGRQDRAPVVLVGPEPGVGPDTAGDEPLEMACRLPGVPVVVDADRLRGGREALRRRADVLLLDDGFQYLGLARDLDLVLVDAGDPWGGGHLPPLGRLREPRRALRRADAVLVTKLRGDDGRLAALRREIERLAPGVPVVRVTAWRRGRWIGPEGPAGAGGDVAGRRGLRRSPASAARPALRPCSRPWAWRWLGGAGSRTITATRPRTWRPSRRRRPGWTRCR